MNATAIAPDLDSLDGSERSALEPRYSLPLPLRRAPKRLRRFSAAIGVVSVAPVILLALAALVLMFVAKLLVELVVARLEH